MVNLFDFFYIEIVIFFDQNAINLLKFILYVITETKF